MKFQQLILASLGITCLMSFASSITVDTFCMLCSQWMSSADCPNDC